MPNVTPQTLMFPDDGMIPNNPRLPFLFYRSAIDLAGTTFPESIVEQVISRNGWGEIWRNGIDPQVQYHSMIHEVMAVARGRARVRFGGAQGEAIELVPGDAVVLPAGTGHQCLWSAPELMVIGAYPKTGRYDLCRGSKAEYARAIEAIASVPLPDTDPVYGANGPLLSLWR
jgi:uncharacterized protein YjlB